MNSIEQNDADYNDDFEFSSVSATEKPLHLDVPAALAGERLDAALAKLLPDYSRSRLSSWIKSGAVLLDGKPAAPKHKLIGLEKIQVAPQASEESRAFTPEAMPLNIVYEDDSIIVLDKPAELVVHPAAGNWSGTLLNGLLAHSPSLSAVPRAGIVHRLDKDTSGLMVVAKTLTAQNHLVRQLQERSVKRTYRAVADGIVPYDGKIDTLIGRDPHNRLKMAVVKFGGKPAVTHIRVLERYRAHSYIECSLETGRTHQIRVHMKEARHPLAGDPVYGNPRHPASEEAKTAVRALSRQALHAFRLGFRHPDDDREMHFEAPLPADFYRLLSVLRLEAGMDSPLGRTKPYGTEDGFDDDDHDVQLIYIRD